MNKSPKEKAIELVNNYMSLLFSKPIFGLTTNEAKQCALIAVHEILYCLNFSLDFKMNKSIKYWLEVEQEINNL
jgi:hypothetical protein